MATTSDISRGMSIKLDGSLYSIIEFGENKTARAAAKVWALRRGAFPSDAGLPELRIP